MTCTACGHVTEDVMADVEEALRCPGCEHVTTHRDACRGGTKTRYRFCDWPDDPAYFRGQVTSSIEPVVDTEGKVSENIHDGTPVHEAPRFDEDVRDEQRDRRYHETDRIRGTLPQVFDQTRG